MRAFLVPFSLTFAATPATLIAQGGLPRAAHVIERGSVLVASDFVIDTSMTRSRRPERPASPGWIARRLIKVGEPLVSPAVTPPPVVVAGDSVRVIWRGQYVEVAAYGVAARAAAAGERLTVVLPDGKRVETIATSRGQARVQ